MARVMLDGCLDKVDNNRFDLVLVAAKRAHQLSSGHYKSTLDVSKDKASIIALREIEEGIIDTSILSETYELEQGQLSTSEQQAKEAIVKEVEEELSQHKIDDENDNINIADGESG